MISLILTYAAVMLVGFGVYKAYGKHLDQGKSVISRILAYLQSPKEAGKAARNAEMLKSISAELYDVPGILEHFQQGTWQREAFDNFEETMTNKERTFPCIYGTKGFKANELDYLFLESENLADTAIAKVAAKGILEYHRIAEQRGKNTSLVIMTTPPEFERSVADYNNLFWDFLKKLREFDPKPWPSDVPKNTSDQFWCFNFDSTQAFIGVLTPAHKNRLSRRCANLCLIYQPRWVFEILFNNDKSRKAATTTVRGLVDKYDLIKHSPDISDYAQPDTTESRQYFLMDENEPTPCPYPSLDVAVAA